MVVFDREKIMARINQLCFSWNSPDENCELYSLRFMVDELSHFLLIVLGLPSFSYEFDSERYTMMIEIMGSRIATVSDWLYYNCPSRLWFEVYPEV